VVGKEKDKLISLQKVKRVN
jgi:hypothetical protein